jgi:hypothetical protein
MYHPAGSSGEEFIELQNISDAVTLDLTGVKFTAGISFDFAGGAITTLGPGARVLLVRNHAACENVHGAGHPIAGEFDAPGALDNDGERLKVEDASNSTIKEFRYNDALPWPTAPDGLGPSLVLRNPRSNPDPSQPGNWRSSALPNGNPGSSDATTFAGTPGADTDSNGLDDLIDYALGNAPGTNDGFSVTAFPDGAVTIAYTENLAADDVPLRAEWSGDLLAWQPLGDDFALLSLTPHPGGRQTVVYGSDPATFPLGGRLFFRLRAQR